MAGRLPLALALTLIVPLVGCATKSDVDRLSSEITAMRSAQDSLFERLAAVRNSLSAALADQEELIVSSRGDVRRQLSDMERQLVQIQELLGQSQIVLRNLRERVEQRSPAVPESQAARSPGDTTGAGEAGRTEPEGEAGDGEPRALYRAAMEQFRRGAYTTARSGFEEFLVDQPAHELAPDAQYYLAETYREEEDAERAIREYNRVVELYPNSSAAPTALYKAGRLQAEQGNKDRACEYFNRVTAGYPRSDESRLARDQAERLNCR